MHKLHTEGDFHSGMDVMPWESTLRVAIRREYTPANFMDLRIERILHAFAWLPLEMEVPTCFPTSSQPGMYNLASGVYWADGPGRAARVWSHGESVNQEMLSVLGKGCWMLYLTSRGLYREVPDAFVENSQCVDYKCP